MQRALAAADRDAKRTQAAAQREYSAAVREQTRLEREAARAADAAQRTDARARAAAEKEARRLYVLSKEAEAKSMTGHTANLLDEIDGILAATLTVDDFVDLEKLRRVAVHPDFESEYSNPVPARTPIVASAEPQYVAPPEPTGLFGKKKRQAEAVVAATEDYYARYREWQAEVASIPARQLQQMRDHQDAVTAQQSRLAHARAQHDAECAERETEVSEHNAQLDELIRGLAAGEPSAVQEYVSIVFSNSLYPADLEPVRVATFDAEGAELRIDIEFPRPDQIPSARMYRYVKAKDEIVPTAQTIKEQRERYASVVRGLTLRTMHEVFESDRAGTIRSISLVGSVRHVDPATGQETVTPLVALATSRETFLAIDLTQIEPAETLKFLGATVSKNPHALIGIAAPSGAQITADAAK